MQYADLVADCSYYLQQEDPDTSYTAAFPTFIKNAELRIYREMDFAASSGQNFSLSTAIGASLVDLSTMTGQTMPDGTAMEWSYPVVLEAIAAKVGTRWIPFQLTSLDFLEATWPDEALTAAPAVGFAYYYLLDDQTVKLAPVPNGIYSLRIAGQWRPAGMSATNIHTWLADHHPDLFFAAVMAEGYAYQRDMRPGVEQPGGAMLWETRYGDIRRLALGEEARLQGKGPAWQPFPPAPLANPMPPPGASA